MSPNALNTTTEDEHEFQNNDNNYQERKASDAEIQRLLAQPEATNGGGNLHKPREYSIYSNVWGTHTDEPGSLRPEPLGDHILLGKMILEGIEPPVFLEQDILIEGSVHWFFGDSESLLVALPSTPTRPPLLAPGSILRAAPGLALPRPTP
jgi:hypothetical protein